MGEIGAEKARVILPSLLFSVGKTTVITMPQNEVWISDRAGIGVFEEDDDFKEHVTHDYVLLIDAQGSTIEFGISERLFEELKESFNDLSRE